MKAFFFDIDGTLAIGRVVPECNKEALKKLKELGYLTFICTGRAPYYAKNMFGDLISGIICCNGRYILYNDEKLHGEAFDETTLNWYLETLKKENLGAMLVSDHQAMAYNLNDNQIAHIKKEYGDNRIVEMSDLPVYTLDIFYKDLEHRDHMIDVFKDKLVINDHGGTGNCDCSTVGYDKGSAIEFILNHFNISDNDAYAFGDGYNDQAMFRVAGHCIAMGNAVDVLKEKATYITTDVDKEGIPNALKHEGILV